MNIAQRPGRRPGLRVTLRAAAGVELVPLDAAAVSRYLRAGVPGPAALARWEPVLAELGTQTPLGQALTTPLMVGLARAIYSPPTGELGADPASPAELCSPALTSRDQVEARLLDGFIPAVYRRPVGRWTADEAENFHLFLARHLDTDLGALDLAWWELPKMVPAKVTTRYLSRAVTLAIAALLAVSIGLGVTRDPRSHLPGQLVSVCFGLLAGWGIGRLCMLGRWLPPPPSNDIRVTRRSGWRGLLSLSWIWIFGFLLIAVIDVDLKLPDTSMNTIALEAGWVGFALLASSALNLGAVPIDVEAAVSPPDTLRRDRRAAIRIGLASGGMSALIAGLVAELPSVSVGYGFSVEAFLVCGLAIGLPVAVRRSLRQAASPSFGLAVLWLAAHQKLPLSLMKFFDDAHRRGVFRQNGATYQFRHRELQSRLAARATVPDASPDTPASKDQRLDSRQVTDA